MASRTVLVVGGSGALGRAVVSKFQGAAWNVLCMDVVSNADAQHEILLPARIDQSALFQSDKAEK